MASREVLYDKRSFFSDGISLLLLPLPPLPLLLLLFSSLDVHSYDTVGLIGIVCLYCTPNFLRRYSATRLLLLSDSEFDIDREWS